MSHALPGARVPLSGGSAQGVPIPIAPGLVVGDRYRVLDELGAGGMGAVFLVEHVHIGRLAAMKVLRVERWSDELVRRFHREARAAARVTSPRVTTVTDFGLDPRFGPFYVMELLTGETLEQRVERDGPVPERDLLEIGVGIAEALVDVHAEGIVHRDVKPSNVGLTTDSVGVKLLDFGLAAATEEAAFLERITRSNEIIGSVAYMSPEQLQGLRPTFAVDLYSVGVSLYEAATGRLPFSGASPGVIIAQHISAAPPPLGLGADERPVSPELEALVHQLMAKDPARRFPSAAALRDVLVNLHERLRPSLPRAAARVSDPQAATSVRSPVVDSGVRARPSQDPALSAPPGARVSPYAPTLGMDSRAGSMPMLPTSFGTASVPPTSLTPAVVAVPPRPSGTPDYSSVPPTPARGHPQPYHVAAPPAWGAQSPGRTERVVAPTLAAMPASGALGPAPGASSGWMIALVGLGAGMLLAALVALAVILAVRRSSRASAHPVLTAPAAPAAAPTLQPDPVPSAAGAPAPLPPSPAPPAPAPWVPVPVPPAPAPVVAPAPAPVPTVAADAGPAARRRPRPRVTDEDRPLILAPRTPPSAPPPPPPPRREPPRHQPWTGEVIENPR